MNRRQFLQSVILGTLAAPFVTRQVRLKDDSARWTFDTSGYHMHPKQREFMESGPRRVIWNYYTRTSRIEYF